MSIHIFTGWKDSQQAPSSYFSRSHSCTCIRIHMHTYAQNKLCKTYSKHQLAAFLAPIHIHAYAEHTYTHTCVHTNKKFWGTDTEHQEDIILAHFHILTYMHTYTERAVENRHGAPRQHNSQNFLLQNSIKILHIIPDCLHCQQHSDQWKGCPVPRLAVHARCSGMQQ